MMMESLGDDFRFRNCAPWLSHVVRCGLRMRRNCPAEASPAKADEIRTYYRHARHAKQGAYSFLPRRAAPHRTEFTGIVRRRRVDWSDGQTLRARSDRADEERHRQHGLRLG